MIDQTLEKIEDTIKKGRSISEKNRAQLLKLLEDLRGEIGDFSKTHQEQARSIVGFAGLSTHEAVREDKRPQLLDLSVNGLTSSAKEFEASHPKLVEAVNAIAHMLSSMGI